MKRSADAAFVVEHIPSSPESVHSAPSPAPSSSSSSDCAPRKRSRSEMSTEERKEARAHRNRIAAQNSRDRRKAQFSYLERRVSELEEENRQLRAGMGMTGTPSVTDGQAEQLARDKARERENEELKERIRTLENGWDAVVKALAASGLPLNIPAPPSLSLPSPSPNTASSRASVVAPVTPITPPPSSPESSMFDAPAAGELETNQLELELRPAPSQTAATSTVAPASAPIDESAMENLFREILAPSPTIPAAALPSALAAEAPIATATPAAAPVVPSALSDASLDWEGEAEMQRLLDMLPDVQSEINMDSVDFPSALELDLGSWNMGSTTASSLPIGAF